MNLLLSFPLVDIWVEIKKTYYHISPYEKRRASIDCYNYAPLVQLDRTIGYGPIGWGFEFSVAHHNNFRYPEWKL